MRTSLAAALAAAMLLGGGVRTAQAQGVVIPPCGNCMPQQCIQERCPPPDRCRPCPPGGAVVERVSSDVRARLDGRVVRFEVEEAFVNRGGGLGEADYLFPLPRTAAFEELQLSINGRMVSGEVLDAAEARRIYEQIVARHRDPALVEWMGHGLLRARIFPFNSGETRRVRVTFRAVVEREGDALRISYLRSTPRPAQLRQRSADADGSGTFRFEYEARPEIGTPYSPTHTLRTTREGSSIVVEATGSSREVVLLLPVRRAAGDGPAIGFVAHAPREGEGYALVTLSPPRLTRDATARDVTLVLDVSGSMSGEKIRQARAAGQQLLATLAPRDRFRLLDFSSEVRSFRDTLVHATPAMLREARRYLDAMEASGGTNIAGALEEALSVTMGNGRIPLVLFITDGEPTVGERNAQRIAARAADLRGRHRVFTFGLGADVNAALVEQLAVDGGGIAHFVTPDESVERAVGILAARLSRPALTNVRLRAEGARLRDQHPMGSVDVFEGQDLVLFTRYAGNGRVRLVFEGESASGPVSWSTNVTLPDRSPENAYVGRLWATQRLGYLAAEKRKRGGSPELDAEIRQLGERWGIPTEFTSYFVREPGMDIALGRDGADPAAPGRVRGAAAMPAAQAREETFQSAKRAAEMRAAVSLSDADVASAGAASGGVGSDRIATAGNRTFVLRDSTWVDIGYREGGERISVSPYSRPYFELLRRIPELAQAAALGENVLIAGSRIAVEFSPGGRTELSDTELRRIVERW